ncbi:hypothetical protein ACFJGW_14270 [Burkholderiaceae bacterium UC74_6]
MSDLHAIAGSHAGHAGKRQVQHDEQAAHAASSTATHAGSSHCTKAADEGVLVSLSHEGLQELEHAATAAARTAKAWVHDVGETAADAVTKVSHEVGETVESAVGYAALAVLAGGALLNELV